VLLFFPNIFSCKWSKGVDRVLWYAYDGDPQWGRLIERQDIFFPAE